jgi:hypothetical protein
MCHHKIDEADFSSLQGLLSGIKIRLEQSHQKSLILRSPQLCTAG